MSSFEIKASVVQLAFMGSIFIQLQVKLMFNHQ